MELIYLLLGILAAIIGALPLGAVNIAVINTTIKQSVRKALVIALAAGIGELVLSVFALRCNVEANGFFMENPWIRQVIVFIFIAVGIYFLAKKSSGLGEKNKLRIGNSKLITGFLLALLNPPVVIYWLLALSLANEHIFMLTENSEPLRLVLFFAGVYLGKVGTLYAYSRWSKKFSSGSGNTQKKIQNIIGFVLLGLGIFQGVRVFILD